MKASAREEDKMSKSLQFENIIQAVLVTEIPVIIALAIWIWFRAGALVRLSAGLEPGFFVPTTPIEAIRSGYIIWLVVSIICGMIASGVFYFVCGKWHWRPVYFAVLVMGFVVLVSVLAFVSGMAFAVEATGEMLIVAAGFGILMPWLAGRKQNALIYRI